MDKNEAIKIIRSNYPTGRNQLSEALETLIPELKKSDDEKIRKTLKSFFDSEISDYGNVEWRNGIRYGEIVSWLEKQCEQKHLFYPIKDYQGSFPCWNNAHYIRPKHLQRCICYDKYMKGVYCYVYDDISKYWCNQMTEEHDSNGDNHVCDYTDYRITRWMPIPYTSLNVHNKVEPKFKVGDWIVSNRTNKTYKIDSIDTKDANYIIYSCVPSVYTNEDSPCFSESMIHLWTIQDAKDGDVLAFYSEYKGNRMVQVGIIKKYVGKHGGCSNTFNIYVGVNWDNNLQIDEYMGCSDIRPATKEQRDLLFVKLKEAGYEWDVEKKELKKIEQKSTWSEEDENLYTRCMSAIQTRFNDGLFSKKEYKQTSLWLKSLKERMKGE